MNTDMQRLHALLGEQISCAEAMLDTLRRENEALRDGDHAALGAATESKARLVETLEALEQQRRALVPGDEPSGAAEWQRLRELIARCKDQNTRNGTLLKARAEHVRVALKALRGSEPELYGASGLAPARIGARTLGSA